VLLKTINAKVAKQSHVSVKHIKTNAAKQLQSHMTRKI
jgi:hypothetical protein